MPPLWTKFTAFLTSRYRTTRILCALVLFLSVVEVYFHIHSFDVAAPAESLDPSFAHGCVPSGSQLGTGDAANANYTDASQAPPDSFEARENATLVMLARNSDLKDAVSAIKSLEEQWNKWFNYPIVFLNDEEWDSEFEAALRGAVSGEATFARVPESMWSWPEDSEGNDKPDRAQAELNWAKMEAQGLPYAATESYHHMCRFYSGFFQDHPALASYKYFFRVEPSVQFTCRIPYDPFRAMRLKDKIYGYTIALWEIGSTCPSLFRTIADYKQQRGIADTSLWTSMIEPSWAPLPVRWFFMSISYFFHGRTRYGDAWSHCHFWSNFEIADLDFFRSANYREYFRELDNADGFFTERWGDAPVHSLALALFARPEQVHYFEDIGYKHKPFQHCPPAQVGCDCDCSSDGDDVVPPVCLNRLRASV